MMASKGEHEIRYQTLLKVYYAWVAGDWVKGWGVAELPEKMRGD